MTEPEKDRIPVICPWCGSVMERGDYITEFNYICPDCGAESPPVTPEEYQGEEQAWEAAAAAALKREEATE